MTTLPGQSAPDVVPTVLPATSDVAGMTDDAYSAWLRNVARVQSGALRFLAERFSKDARTLERFAVCRSPAEFAQLQFQIGSEAIADYLGETRQMVTLLDPAIADSALPVC